MMGASIHRAAYYLRRTINLFRRVDTRFFLGENLHTGITDAESNWQDKSPAKVRLSHALTIQYSHFSLS